MKSWGARSEAPEPTNGSNLLVTGSTGLLGGAIAAELLASPEWPSVLMLVRGEAPQEAHSRLVRSLGRFVSSPELLARIRPEQVLVGDFTAPESFLADHRLRSVRQVIHCAALTSFGVNGRAFTTNVDGTLRFVAGVREACGIDRFLHVSTAMVCGADPPPLVRETDYPRSSVKHLVSYSDSKAEAERRLRETFAGFPLVVARPSIIVGHTVLGCAPSGSIFWAFRISEALRMIFWRSDGFIDVVPVDYAARAVLHLLRRPELAHDCYHVSAGRESSCRWEEIAQSFARASPCSHGAARSVPAYRRATLEEIAGRKPEFDGLFGPCNKAFMMKAIKLYGAFAGLDTVFDTSRLRAEGFGPAPRFSDYLETCNRTSVVHSIADQMLTDFL